ncbi:hypothetical protein [Fimbriiglobus ruber]|uniref:DUF1508 domain-containing protein n=1 Tax=Fimbriiglobus ruber TaxID=1908690 RepID=A0A225E0H9_9BACT|nr:hypothetical protein [Fimbriiglobus ruber]OWK47062.1 hypothetical protein FRUB_00761 [Fimbriiglobus ruber]
MSKLIRSLVLMLAMAGVTTTVISIADAQTTKDAKKDDTKDDSKETKTTKKKDTKKDTKTTGGTIEIKEGKDGKYRIGIRDGDGKYLAGSLTGHSTKEEAAKAAENLKEVIATAKIVYPKKDDKDTKEK